MFYRKQGERWTWKDTTLDFKLLFVYHGTMMVMFAAGQSLTVREEVLVTLLLLAVLVAISIRHRRKTNWHWPGIGFREFLYALWAIFVVGFFLFGATPLFPPLELSTLPWYLAGIGIGLFGILSALRVVSNSETEFLRQCRTRDQYGQEIAPVSELPRPKPTEIGWKKVAPFLYFAAFLLVWSLGVLAFYFYGQSFKNGSPVPTATQTEPLTDHGKTVYVTPKEKRRIDGLRNAMFIGIPAVLGTGAILHFMLGVKVFGNTGNRD